MDVDDAVVQGLYQAAAGMLRWNIALAGLDAAIGSVVSQLVVLDKTDAVRIKSRTRGDALCSVWDMRPETSMEAFAAQPAALLTVALPRMAGDADPMLIGSMFDLTPAEVRLANALMKGEGMARIAAVRRVSITTVRAQLKAIFAKTNTHRRPNWLSY